MTAIRFIRRRLRIPGRVWIAIHRTQNRWRDLRAVLASYCNHSPYNGIPGEGGGYCWWRCALRRGHSGVHRYRNYVWDEQGHTQYAPINPMPDQPWVRASIMTRRQSRQRRAWHQAQAAKRRSP